MDVVRCALTSTLSTPSCDSSIDAVRPAPPPPTIRTGVLRTALALRTASGA
jgi:hypothetical protein